MPSGTQRWLDNPPTSHGGSVRWENQRTNGGGFPIPMFDYWVYDISHLVGGFSHLEKYESVNGKDDIPYMTWKIKHVPNHQSAMIFP